MRSARKASTCVGVFFLGGRYRYRGCAVQPGDEPVLQHVGSRHHDLVVIASAAVEKDSHHLTVKSHSMSSTNVTRVWCYADQPPIHTSFNVVESPVDLLFISNALPGPALFSRWWLGFPRNTTLRMSSSVLPGARYRKRNRPSSSPSRVRMSAYTHGQHYSTADAQTGGAGCLRNKGGAR